MSCYRPICDTWILARSKVNYPGAFPNGFLERARALLGVGLEGAVLHVCSGRVREYPNTRCLGPHDRTLDLDPACAPDFLQDARDPLPGGPRRDGLWDAALVDRPYTEYDATKYVPGEKVFPSINALLRNALQVVPIGGKIGVLDYVWPQPPTWAREVAVVAVGTGRNNRARWFTVFERLS